MNVDFKYFFALLLMLLSILSGCKKDQESLFSTPAETHENRGLKLRYPKNWKLEYDGYGIQTDRYISFHLSNFSTIDIAFYKSKPTKIDILEDKYINKLSKSNVAETTAPQIEKISIAGFSGTSISWTNYFMGESKEQGVVIQIQNEPFPIFVDAYLFEEDIDEYWKHIEPFLKSITFDPNKIELDEPSLF